MEQAAILREIVEQAKSLNPLDSVSYSACKYVKLIQELLGYVRVTCPDIHKPSEKLVVVTPINKKKTVRFVESIISSSTSQTMTKQTTKNFVSTSTGVNRSTKSSKSKSTDNTKNDRILQISRRTFTLVGNACPLTRITATNKVPLRVPIPLEVVAQESVITKVYTRRPKVPKTNGSNSKPKIAKSVISNKTEPDTSWGSNTLVAPNGNPDNYSWGSNTSVAPSSYSSIDLRLSKLFCDLEVAFKKHTCFVRNLEGVDLLSGSWETNLYTLSIGDMMASSPICLLSKASKTKSWLWHRRLSHLNFGVINHLAKNSPVRGLLKLKFEKDHLCSACAMGKSKKQSHKPKSEDTNQEKLYLLHMDLYGPMRVTSVNGKKHILIIMDDYSRFTWVKFLASKDEASYFIIKFLKMIQVRLNATVKNIRTDNGTEFVNQTLRSYFESVVATACYTQNQSIIWRRHRKTPYELLHDRKPYLSYLHVFGALCYPNNDSEDLGKLQAKADIGIFIGYAPKKKAYHIYKPTYQKNIETIHVDFDELTAMASEQLGSGPALQSLTLATSCAGLVPNPIPQQPCIPPPRDD
ncbi:retrovirus-related pol polyprotein from transposon TNT 1-94 [Tanacetum coccineum]